MRSVDSRDRDAAEATSRSLFSTSPGIGPPSTRGAKYRSWRIAAAWKVRAWTPPTSRAASRPRSSPAARAVKVTARTCSGT